MLKFGIFTQRRKARKGFRNVFLAILAALREKNQPVNRCVSHEFEKLLNIYEKIIQNCNTNVKKKYLLINFI
jgi:hypothetical protein